MLLLVEVLKAHACSQRAKDRQGSNDHSRAERLGQAATNQIQYARKGRELGIGRYAIGRRFTAIGRFAIGVFCDGDGAIE